MNISIHLAIQDLFMHSCSYVASYVQLGHFWLDILYACQCLFTDCSGVYTQSPLYMHFPRMICYMQTALQRPMSVLHPCKSISAKIMDVP